MVKIIDQINTIRDPELVERILIANSRTFVRELKADDFMNVPSLIKSVESMLMDNKPFVVRGAARGWKVVKRFTDIEALMEQAKREHDSFPDRKYTLYEPDADGYLNQSHAAPYGLMTFYQFLIRGKTKGLYLLGVPEKDGRRGASPFETRKHELSPPIFASDIDSDHQLDPFIKLFEGSVAVRRHVFFNSCRSRTNLHYDTDMNMYLCALGRRRWTLAHPGHATILAASNGNANYSRLMPTKGTEGLSLHRLAHLVKFVTVDLEPGDLLFVPPTWWHVVEGLLDDFSCGINWFFTFPVISTYSRLDSGWEWLSSRDRLAIPSSMGAVTNLNEEQDETSWEEIPDQPSGAEENLRTCFDDNYVDVLDAEVKRINGNTGQYEILRPLLKRGSPDYIIARQLSQIALNTCKSEMGDAKKFSTLCSQVVEILEKRKEHVGSNSRNKRRRDSGERIKK